MLSAATFPEKVVRSRNFPPSLLYALRTNILLRNVKRVYGRREDQLRRTIGRAYEHLAEHYEATKERATFGRPQIPWIGG